MDPIGTDIASSAAGAPEAKRAAQRALRRQGSAQTTPNRRIRDDAEFTADVEDVEATEALRQLARNEQEEAHEERQEGGYYDAQGEQQAPPESTLDLEG